MENESIFAGYSNTHANTFVGLSATLQSNEPSRFDAESIEIPIKPTILPPRFYFSYKRGCDLFFASILVVILFPIILITAFLVWVTTFETPFYSQIRVGRLGRCFRIYKFRTIGRTYDKGLASKWSPTDDPRITRFGRFLRRTRIDELPQLWNVLKGDMSLVGPCSERPEFANILQMVIPNYHDRHIVRPGVIGLAQIVLPPDTDMSSVHRKVIYDLYYIRTMSLFLDCRLMIGSVMRVLGFSSKLIQRILWLPRKEKIDNTSPEDSAVISIV
jgi:lipopolysaccharide/colanic/teichoic acid biosynthesis glycosyltransferase